MKSEAEIREEQCKDLRCQGYSYKDIATELGIGLSNVNYYLRREKAKEYSKKYDLKRERKDYNCVRKKQFYENIVCLVCGGNDKICYHHTDKDSKSFTIKDVVHCPNKYSKEQIKEEIKKCIPLCIHCHRKLHCGSLKGYEHLWNGEIRLPNPKSRGYIK